MKFPWYKEWNNAICTLELQSTDPNENGDFPVVLTGDKECNLSEKATTVRSTNGEYIRLSCVVHIEGDILPDYSTFSGSVTVNGRKMLIETVDRPRNPDGTVHHTRLGLI